jgi:hypothetical protein
MCEEAKVLIIECLDAQEQYDRVHLIFLAAYRRNDTEALEGYRNLLQEAKFNLQAGRERLQRHQKSHNCSEAIRFGEDFEQ